MENNINQKLSPIVQTPDVLAFTKLLKKTEILNILNICVFISAEDKVKLNRLYNIFNLSLNYQVNDKEEENFNRQT